MNKLLRIFVAMAALSVFYSSSNAAQIDCLENGHIRLAGKIQSGDYENIVECKKQLLPTPNQNNTLTGSSDDKSPSYFVVDSPGGSVYEAMKIGKYIRDNKMWVTVPSDGGKCFSACIYLLAAGVIRNPFGDIAIHRPYFDSKPNQGYDAALKKVLEDSRAYFWSMNIPESLADEMFSISPQDMKTLGDISLTKYRLNQYDMAFDEENTIRNAASYGLSREEYLARLKKSEKFMDECLATDAGPASTSSVVKRVVQCGAFADKKAGLNIKKE